MILMQAGMLSEEINIVPPEQAAPHVWGSGSRRGKAPNLERRRVFYSHLLFYDFWGNAPLYNASYFKRFLPSYQSDFSTK
jgi:hypothetical protein